MPHPVPRILLVLAALSFPAVPSAELVGEPIGSISLPADAGPDLVLRTAREQLAPSDPLIGTAELRLEHRREGLSGVHYRYGQWIDGRRVHGGELLVSLGHDGRIIRHHVALASPRQEPKWRDDLMEELARRNPEWRDRRVISRVRAYRNDRGTARPIERLLVEDGPFLHTAWEIDPSTGTVLSKIPLYASVLGRVFPANPVTTLNDDSLRDEGDSPAAVPEESYVEADLAGLGESGSLAGPRVRIVDIDSPFTSRAMIETGLSFARDRDEFEEVNAYHHLDRSQLYLQSLGYTGTRQIVPEGVRADVHASNGSDNSYFTSTSQGPTILFGDGGVDDAEDPDIVLHEYAHAIHDSIAPQILFGGANSQGRAIGEGFGDYWAFSAGHPASVESGRDPYCIGDWDARCDGAGCAYPRDSDCLRRVDQELTIDDYAFSTSSGTEHRNGRIWSTFLRDLFDSLTYRHGAEQGRRITDTLAIESFYGAPSEPRFAHLVATMIDADAILFASENTRTICTAARARKFEVPPACHAPAKGQTLVVPGTESLSILSGGGEAERRIVLHSDSTIERVLVALEFAADPPPDLEITLTAPDGERVVLAAAGTSLPRSVSFGRDRLSKEPLEIVEGRPNPGTWRLRLAASTSAVLVRDWSVHFELDSAAKLDRREHLPGSITIPAVAHTPGSLGTFFVSDLAISNTGGPGELMLIHTPSGADGTTDFRAVRVAIAAGESFLLNDVLRTVFDVEGSGSLEIRGAGPGVMISSRTSNHAPGGSFGQTIPAVADSIRFGERLYVTQLRRDIEYRTNIGLVETAGRPSDAVVTLRDRNGLAAGSTSVRLEPFTHRQIPIGTFATVSEIDFGWAEIEITNGEGAVAAYSSVVDNRTGDSVFAPAVPSPSASRPLVVPAAAHVPGAAGTNWRTDLWLLNGSDEDVSVVLTFHRSAGGSAEASVTVPARSTRALEDVVNSIVSEEATGWISVSDSPLMVSSRTWNTNPAGSYGQFIGSVTLDAASVQGDTVVVPHVVMSESFRTNVGVTEVSGAGATVRIDVVDRAGNLSCSAPLTLRPNQHWQSSVVQFGCGALEGGRVAFHHLGGEGRTVSYASIVDQRTGDPSYVRAE